MVLVTNNWRMWAAGMAASLIIFAILFFTVIKPNSDTANQAVKTGLQQSQQVINQAKQQLSNATSQAAGAAGSSGASGAVNTANAQGQQALSTASKLTACVAAAGTDATKLAACQTH
jgi:hypothetical protein